MCVELNRGSRFDGSHALIQVSHVLGLASQSFKDDKTVISIAAGVPTSAMESALLAGPSCQAPRVVRVMPNTPSLVGAGASAIAGKMAVDIQM